VDLDAVDREAEVAIGRRGIDQLKRVLAACVVVVIDSDIEVLHLVEVREVQRVELCNGLAVDPELERRIGISREVLTIPIYRILPMSNDSTEVVPATAAVESVNVCEMSMPPGVFWVSRKN
jgi:hypothetical protein